MLDDNQIKLEKAIAAHEADDLITASELYYEILQINPHDPDANHNLGLLTVQLGDYEGALLFLENAISINQDVHEYWVSLIDTLIKLNRYQDAKTSLAVAKQYGHNEQIFFQIEQFLELQDVNASEVQNLVNDPPAAVSNSLLSYLKRGEAKKFSTKIKKLFKKYPYSPLLCELQALAFRAEKKNFEAIECYKQSLSMQPNAIECMISLAMLQIQTELFNDAIKTLKDGLRLDPQNSTILWNLGYVHKRLNLIREAIGYYEECILVDPKNADAYVNLGNALASINNLEAAIQCLRTAIDLDPKNADNHYTLALHLQAMGDKIAAENSLNEALTLYPDHAHAHFALASIKHYQTSDPHFQQMLKVKNGVSLSRKESSLMHFALGKASEDQGNTETAFRHYVNANYIQNQINKYKSNEQDHLFQAIYAFEKELQGIKWSVTIEDTDVTPIFIVGMPRSGTTLTEQIISSHSLVSAAGELTHVGNFGDLLLKRKINPTQAQISLFRKSYLQDLNTFTSINRFVTDKMPHNFLHIPLILKAFPESKIIHVKRDARATCWSNFKTSYQDGNIKYSYDLSALVSFYQNYSKLMQHFNQHHGSKIYNLDYETLVSSPDDQIRNLINYLGIEFEEDCLSPQNNQRAIRTASKSQVRGKIYKGSSNNWKKFEPFLNDAFDKLANL